MVGSRTNFKNTLCLGGIVAGCFTTVWHQNVQVESPVAADCLQFHRDADRWWDDYRGISIGRGKACSMPPEWTEFFA